MKIYDKEVASTTVCEITRDEFVRLMAEVASTMSREEEMDPIENVLWLLRTAELTGEAATKMFNKDNNNKEGEKN